MALSLLGVASLAVAGPTAAGNDANALCPPSRDPLEQAARREIEPCAMVQRNDYGEVIAVGSPTDPTGKLLRAFVQRHPRDFGLASIAELGAVADPPDSVAMRQRVAGLPAATVRCDAPETVLNEKYGIPGGIAGFGGYWQVCLVPDLAAAAARPRIAEASAKAIAVAESRASGDENPRAGALTLVGRRRHDKYERRGVLVYRVIVNELLGYRYVDVEVDTGQVLGTMWTSQAPSAPSTGDPRW